MAARSGLNPESFQWRSLAGALESESFDSAAGGVPSDLSWLRPEAPRTRPKLSQLRAAATRGRFDLS